MKINVVRRKESTYITKHECKRLKFRCVSQKPTSHLGNGCSPPRPSRPGKKEIAVVRALYAYQAQNADELTFEEGAVLYVLEKDDPNWWKCRCEDKEGLVPANYVGENTAQIENPLHEAAKRGNVSFALELLNAGVSVNTLDKAGNTPLHWACRGGHADVVKLLLEKKPTLNSQNKLGDTLCIWRHGLEACPLSLICSARKAFKQL
ncbi:SH3 domain-containing protein [Chytridium lagenaria]|nr:SH3 domain-containing protein [Chytridium lagenaria]